MSPQFVEVAVNLPPVRGTFDYHLPSDLEGTIQLGHLITAPFGKRRVQGVVVGTPSQPAVPETRPIEALLDPDPVLTHAQLELAHWLRDTTLASLIDCITLMLPPGLSQKADTCYALSDVPADNLTPTQAQLVRLLNRRGPLRARQIQRALPRRNWRRAADALVRSGVLYRSSVLDPPRVGARSVRTARLAVSPRAARQAFPELGMAGRGAILRRQAILEVLIQEGEPLEVTWIYAETGATLRDLRYLEERGLIALGEAEVWRDPLAELDFVAKQPPPLTRDQSGVWEQVRAGMRTAPPDHAPAFLLHGVTGSGKTEIYLRAVAEALALGRGALVLVPEIALTPQTVRRFLARFPGQVGLIHSQLSDGERYDTWRRARQGSLQVIIGARSALFAPLPDIGLIVLDESHDESYKESGRSPRYHARETAFAYARILRSVCLLGSATPDVVTMYAAQEGKLKLLELPQRILGHQERITRQSERYGIKTRYRPLESAAQTIDLPPVRIIDMRAELRAGNTSIFSRALQDALAASLGADEQVILFLNRRGAATHIFCRDCGWVARCPRCDTALTHHTPQGRLVCHHCGYRRKSLTTCPECGGARVRHFGAGTQTVQAELERRFPEVHALRWDRDATRSKGAHDVILGHFVAHRADVLIGTQMIAKGLDLPLVTLVGVISADTALNLPDYRTAERTFQVLTQVSGRAGRGLLGGRVILQTYQPEHYAIRAASEHDYAGFYMQELQHRKELNYPPFVRLARLVLRALSPSDAEGESERMAAKLRARIAASDIHAEIIGPAPCFYAKVRGYYRWQIVLRSTHPEALLPEKLAEAWTLDIDPVSLL